MECRPIVSAPAGGNAAAVGDGVGARVGGGVATPGPPTPVRGTRLNAANATTTTAAAAIASFV